jgi:hypothetical protein
MEMVESKFGWVGRLNFVASSIDPCCQPFVKEGRLIEIITAPDTCETHSQEHL